jgi:ribosomal protein L37E
MEAEHAESPAASGPGLQEAREALLAQLKDVVACRKSLGRAGILPLQRAITHGAPTELVKRISAAYPEAHASLIREEHGGQHVMNVQLRTCEHCGYSSRRIPGTSMWIDQVRVGDHRYSQDTDACDMHMTAPCPEPTRIFLLEACGQDPELAQRALGQPKDMCSIEVKTVSTMLQADLDTAAPTTPTVAEAEPPDRPYQFAQEVQQLCSMGFDADDALVALVEVSKLGVARAEVVNEAVARLVS